MRAPTRSKKLAFPKTLRSCFSVDISRWQGYFFTLRSWLLGSYIEYNLLINPNFTMSGSDSEAEEDKEEEELMTKHPMVGDRGPWHPPSPPPPPPPPPSSSTSIIIPLPTLVDGTD
ncbi:hypothetical protein KR074_009541 [Drosophila pseudoananassae]|nr:hypothetical protein KR074_009541 [Drosophila pseudoananassae]